MGDGKIIDFTLDPLTEDFIFGSKLTFVFRNTWVNHLHVCRCKATSFPSPGHPVATVRRSPRPTNPWLQTGDVTRVSSVGSQAARHASLFRYCCFLNDDSVSYWWKRVNVIKSQLRFLFFSLFFLHVLPSSFNPICCGPPRSPTNPHPHTGVLGNFLLLQ